MALRVIGPTERADAIREFEGMVQAYRALWAGEPSAGLFDLPGTRAFYLKMIDDLLPLGYVHSSVLMLEGAPVSWHFGFLYQGALHYYKPTYAVRLASHSPGKVHLAMLVDQGIRSGWRHIDLGCGMEEYKSRWTDSGVELRQVAFRTSAWHGTLCQAARLVKQTVYKGSKLVGHSPAL